MHNQNPIQCEGWPTPSYSPCTVDAYGEVWHNIGWYPKYRIPELKSLGCRISERNDPPYGSPEEMVEVFRQLILS